MTAKALVRGTDENGLVELELAGASRCEGCAGVCMWRRMPALTKVRFATRHPLQPGMEIVISVPQKYVLLSAMLLHGLPWAALLSGALLGAMLTESDFGALLGAVAAVGLSILLTPGLRRRLEQVTMQHFELRS